MGADGKVFLGSTETAIGNPSPPTSIQQTLLWKKAQQRLYFLHQLSKLNLPQELLTQFYSAVTESVLCSSITVWFGSATKSDIRRLQRTVWTAERIIGAPPPTLQDLYSSRVRKRAGKIITDSTHPATTYLNSCRRTAPRHRITRHFNI
ncbi:hypothetical protein DPX16_15064 [Anabarilius grahami]|uniref:Alkylated DNA repair protein AlkB homologue 8 N-terminal domain-containing protein n=1 Tax=Anabarilius grahami TaxID=495550 RepID=A0A3N0YXG1_ANAGA|nr:hypothetical protein DPX16_15064 [Anabarilius grahami]